MQPAYNAPVYQPPAREPPRLGPMRGPNLAALQPAALQPPATLACPIVSALDRWVSEGVQPAALHWFGSPVTSIHQIGGYSCRGMVGGSGVSEHSFGNALDVAGFTLADGRKIRSRPAGTARRKSRASCTTCSSTPARPSPRCWRPATTSITTTTSTWT